LIEKIAHDWGTAVPGSASSEDEDRFRHESPLSTILSTRQVFWERLGRFASLNFPDLSAITEGEGLQDALG